MIPKQVVDINKKIIHRPTRLSLAESALKVPIKLLGVKTLSINLFTLK